MTSIFETTLRRALLVLLLALPCIVGALTSYLMLILALIAAIYAATQYKSLRFAPDTLTVIFCAVFAALAVLYTITAQAPADIAFVFNFAFLLVYAALAWLFGRHARLGNAQVIANLALAGAGLAMLMAFAEIHVFHSERAGQLTSDPIRFGGIALLLGFLSLLGLLRRDSVYRWAYLLGPVFGLVAVYLSGSRSSLLAFPVLSILAVLLLMRRKLLAVGICIGVIAAFVAGLLIVDVVTDSRASTLVDIAHRLFSGQGISDGSLNIRLDIYRSGLIAFSQSPIFGHGWARLTLSAAPYFHGPGPLPHYSHLHNDMLDFAVSAGIFGIALYILLILAPVIACLRSPRDGLYTARLYGCVILAVGYFLLGSSSLMLGFEFPTALYVGLCAILLGYCREAPRKS